MRETLISAGRRAPHEADRDTRDVVARYRHRRARRQALLGSLAPALESPVTPVAADLPAQPEGWSC